MGNLHESNLAISERWIRDVDASCGKRCSLTTPGGELFRGRQEDFIGRCQSSSQVCSPSRGLEILISKQSSRTCGAKQQGLNAFSCDSSRLRKPVDEQARQVPNRTISERDKTVRSHAACDW